MKIILILLLTFYSIYANSQQLEMLLSQDTSKVYIDINLYIRLLGEYKVCKSREFMSHNVKDYTSDWADEFNSIDWNRANAMTNLLLTPKIDSIGKSFDCITVHSYIFPSAESARSASESIAVRHRKKSIITRFNIEPNVFSFIYDNERTIYLVYSADYLFSDIHFQRILAIIKETKPPTVSVDFYINSPTRKN